MQLSIIIPVLKEAHIINRTLSHLSCLSTDVPVEVIVVDGDPNGETLNAIDLKNVIQVIGEKGRGAQINKGAEIASGEVILMLHADTILPENGLKDILVVCDRTDYAGGAFNLGVDSKKKIFRLIEWVVFFRTRLTRIPYGDQAIFLKKQFFHQIGGCQNISIMEDVNLMMRVKQAGGKIIIIPSKVRTSPRRWEKEGVLFCTLRNWMILSLYFAGVPPHRLSKFYK